MSISSLQRRQLVRPAAALIIAVASLAAWAGVPSFAGPSMAKASESVQFVGRGFAANSAVSLAVTSPSGQESHHSAVVGNWGGLAYKFHPTEPGAYTIRVLDTGGQELSRALVNVTE